MAILSIYTDASFKRRGKKKPNLARIGYVTYCDKVKTYEFFSEDILLPKPYDNNDAEVLAVIHVLDLIHKNLSELSYLNVKHIEINTDNEAVKHLLKKYDLNDYITDLSRKQISVNIKHLSRNNPRIKYVDYNLRFN